MNETPPRWHTPRSAYIHVPFCRTMCAYCDFATFAGVEQHIPAYVVALAEEIRNRSVYGTGGDGLSEAHKSGGVGERSEGFGCGAVVA